MCVVSLSSPHRLSSISVVFDFNASLINETPVSPIMLSVDLVRVETSGLLIDAICVCVCFFFFVCVCVCVFTIQKEYGEYCV